MPEIKEQPFRLNQDDPVISEGDGTASTWSDIWEYQVPQGTALILKPGNTFAAYLEDASAEVGSQTCMVKIEKRDASKSDVLVVFGPTLYARVKEFQQLSKMARLSVGDDGVIVNEREYLVISVYDDGAIDASDSYFEIHTAKVRKALSA